MGRWAVRTYSCFSYRACQTLTGTIGFQEPDYGALYEGRNPGFYVEANPMPTFKVQVRPVGTGSWGWGPQLPGVCICVFRVHLWSW